MAGYLLAVLLGTLIGYLCERSRTAELLLSPLLSIITATPVASVIILTLVWIGKQLVPSLIVMLIVIPVVASHTRAGLAGIDRSLVSLCRIYGLPRTVVLRKLYLPSMLPDLSAGLSTALGLAWKSGVAAEGARRSAALDRRKRISVKALSRDHRSLRMDRDRHSAEHADIKAALRTDKAPGDAGKVRYRRHDEQCG